MTREWTTGDGDEGVREGHFFVRKKNTQKPSHFHCPRDIGPNEIKSQANLAMAIVTQEPHSGKRRA